MGVILEELIKQIDSTKIKNIAGSKGLTNLVEWAHMVDNVEIASFLTGGEVAFTTGIGIKEDMTPLDLATAVHKQGAAVMDICSYVEKDAKNYDYAPISPERFHEAT